MRRKTCGDLWQSQFQIMSSVFPEPEKARIRSNFFSSGISTEFDLLLENMF
jgi:hypothetical protein